MMMQALATRDALRIFKANTHRPDLFIHENGAWYLPDQNVNGAFHPLDQNAKSFIAHGNTFNTQSTKEQMSTEDALEVLQSNKPHSNLFIHSNGGISLDEFEIINPCEHKSSTCKLS